MATKKQNWKPVRHAQIYCSPACGCGCTWRQYQLAHARGRHVEEILGTGWKRDVWENTGWHWKVVSACGKITVTGEQGKPYFAEISAPFALAWGGFGKTPAKAVGMAFQDLLLAQGQITDLVNITRQTVFQVMPRLKKGAKESIAGRPK